jgi:hypothetical protein
VISWDFSSWVARRLEHHKHERAENAWFADNGNVGPKAQKGSPKTALIGIAKERFLIWLRQSRF